MTQDLLYKITPQESELDSSVSTGNTMPFDVI